MKKFFKFIIIFILVIVLLVGAIVGTTLFVLSDKTNEVDIESYEEMTTQEAISGPLNDALSKMKDDYELYLRLNEAQINNLIYSVIKAKLNPSYNPKNGTTEAEMNVYTGVVVPEGVPVLGGRSVNVKSAYVKINDDLITFNVTADAAGLLKTRVHFTLKIETTDTDYKITITEAKIGKINALGKAAKRGYEEGDVEKSVNDSFSKNGIPLTLSIDNQTLIGKKEDVNAWIAKTIIGNDENALKESFVNLLCDSENDLISIGINDNKLGVRIELERLKVDNDLVTLDSRISEEFNQDAFITGKSQTYIVNCMTGNHTITFTELEINKLLYSNTNGYNGLGASMNLMEGVPFEFKVDGIIFDISDLATECQIRVILNVDGLLTTAVVSGDMDDTTGDIKIILDDKLTLGRDFLVDSSLVTDLMSGAFDSNSIISFDKANNSLLIKKEIMTTMLSSAGADGGAKMEVERLASIANGIKAYIAYNDSELEATVASVVSAAETALANDFVDETQFNTEDEDQQEAVSTLMEELSTVSEILSDPEQELTEENTDALVEAINNLSEENQQALYEQFASEIGEDELRRLYEQMFGGGN